MKKIKLFKRKRDIEEEREIEIDSIQKLAD